LDQNTSHIELFFFKLEPCFSWRGWCVAEWSASQRQVGEHGHFWDELIERKLFLSPILLLW